MSQSLAFYQERAAECAAEAQAAVLLNVRDRALRSEAAWQALANRALRIEKERKAAQAEKDAAREADELESGSV